MSNPSNVRQTDARAAIDLAEELLIAAQKLQTPQERRQQAELNRMIDHDADKATLVEMTDQAFRTNTPARVADQLSFLLDVQGIPRFFSPVEQAMLRGFQSFGEYLPGVAVPLVKDKMRQETANVILPAEPELLVKHLRKRQETGVSMNVNLLGEALLGEDDARGRLQTYIHLLRLPDIRCLSVKLTTLYSQVSSLAYEHTISIVSDRLESLYRNANHHSPAKFIYLDMEEYKDLHLTADILKRTLDRRGLEQTAAGIALQAYVPDSYGVMQDLIAWSKKRVTQGGRPLTIRLVKGANWEMERVHASVSGWPMAPYCSKLETDANYKKMLRELIDASAEGFLRVGVASHNLFDVALAMIWCAEAKTSTNVQFEMLEGMANHQRRAITNRGVPMLLYAPACRRVDFLNAIGYLIRRLDENTGPENFLRHSYSLQTGSETFARLAQGFESSLQNMDSVSTEPRNPQDRTKPPAQPPAAAHWTDFVCEPDTDWSLPHHARWASDILQQWKTRCDENAVDIQPVLATENTLDDDASNPWLPSYDISRPEKLVCRVQQASSAQLTEAIHAVSQWTQWRDKPAASRYAILRQVAQNLRERRGDLIGAMVADAGKTVAQGDPEVSEAIDFCEFYPLTMVNWLDRKEIDIQPRGIVAVITPWNFPLAIACGGIAAALAAGNIVVLKPSAETVLPAFLLCQAFWDAGVPINALQFAPCPDQVAEQTLVANPEIDTVILTGGTATAKRMLHVRPDLHLLAETGGKNATIVTAMADRDLAIKHVLYSAFGHSGQKCSATSLLLLEDEVFNDESFKQNLADAVRSLHVGSAWDLHTAVTPLVSPPNDELTRGLRELDDDESWLVMPEHVDGNPTLYRPGVKWNVKPGSFSHTTELFGPVLSVISYGRLEEAIEIVKSTGYGLTSGLESLDKREIELWRENLPAGNLYINRPTTGAIVLRQPFGGVGMSAYGPGLKAGGPHYVLALCKITDSNLPETSVEPPSESKPTAGHPPLDRLTDWLERSPHTQSFPTSEKNVIQSAIASARTASDSDFSREHDTFQLVGQDNLRRYLAAPDLTLRIAPTSEEDSVDELRERTLIAVAAATAVSAQLTLSIDPKVSDPDRETFESIADWLPGLIDPLEESESQLAKRIRNSKVSRLRSVNRLRRGPVRDACAEMFVSIIDEPVLRDARIECLRYINEQSISYDYHRYGNLGRRQTS
ncbi:proline dehydrogenase family protein [Aporhodopirellula aestuarii]|uniref:L-glutamate gamma-semialdehyde dehydrogenase n=1 Tax=Aporhodopirellula aestuarii TaxID=2950107 RepID=A0ABT0U9K5_9BACT|nr:bifunctional proline dehydrogenase/L-glutamate gamma-semialdehyde dehydrogenase [Aporhodopirellula aestuarii]MCM2373088.1 bifunctional proline dehydrogenase/L-glutamate gamma-semialdehyde dehydrogenase [Aporhodopirellula aestuarii]